MLGSICHLRVLFVKKAQYFIAILSIILVDQFWHLKIRAKALDNYCQIFRPLFSRHILRLALSAVTMLGSISDNFITTDSFYYYDGICSGAAKLSIWM